MRTSSFFLCTVLVASLVAPSVPSVAWAQSTKTVSKADKAEAARFKKEGDAFMAQDHYVDALGVYQKAYDLSPDPALLYNQGRALEAMGEYPDAVDKLEKFDKEATPALRAKVPKLGELILDLKGRIATLVVTTNATNARVLLRDKAAGTIVGEMKIRTRAGPASVEVAAEGYNTFKQDVNLTAGTTVKVDAQLQLKKSDALIIIHSKPFADISLDGKPIGRSPLEFRASGGQHTLVADADGYEAEKVPMTLALGDRRELAIELHKSPPITSRWWFWASVAGVAVTGIVIGGYVALTTERTPDPGTFGSGKRPAEPSR